ncbi:MAG TPA: ATP-binding protein [Pseudonocardiaceae bacterium]|jgi:two-component system CitB family sensor kinase
MDVRRWSLARQLVVLQISVVVLTVGIEAMVGVYHAGIFGPDTTHPQLLNLVALTEIALTVGLAGSLLIAGRVHRQTLGLEPAEIARQYQHHDAMLHAVSDGLLITDPQGRLVLVNDEARRLLGLQDGAAPEDLTLTGTIIADLPADDAPIRDRLCISGDRVLLLSRNPVQVDDAPIGAVTTLRDRTELQEALRELSTVKALADSLRAQTHETANRLQALVGMVELGRYDEAVALGTRETARIQHLQDQLLDRVGEPALMALLLGKTKVAQERGVKLVVSEDSVLTGQPRWDVEDLLTVVGNLVDNAVDAAASAGPGCVELSLREADSGGLCLLVRDSGPGLPAGHREDIFTLGWSTKDAIGPAGRGMGLFLVRQVVQRCGGTITAVDDGAGTRFEVFLPERATVSS